MAEFLLHHRHEPSQCGVVFTAFRGHASPLRHHPTVGSCLTGGHEIWWKVDAASAEEALALLPSYVGDRTVVTRVGKVDIP